MKLIRQVEIQKKVAVITAEPLGEYIINLSSQIVDYPTSLKRANFKAIYKDILMV